MDLQTDKGRYKAGFQKQKKDRKKLWNLMMKIENQENFLCDYRCVCSMTDRQTNKVNYIML